ncbi:PGA59 Cell wall protein PGA59 [Candida maltosa Xu316]
MQFSTVAILSAVAGSALATFANSTVTEIGTTVVTITSCEENKCHETAVTTGVVTVTEIDTTYTTYCPLTSEEAAPSTVAANSTAPVVSTHEAGAAKAVPAVAAGLLALGALF